MKLKKVVVTGGNGFVGRNLCSALREVSKEIVVVDVDPCIERIAGVTYIEQDINLIPKHNLVEIFEGSQLIHLAAISSSQLCESNPTEALDVNIGLTSKIIEAANSSETKIVFASSEWVYSDSPLKSEHLEDDVLSLTSQTNFYSMSKIVGEWLLQRYCHNYLILRFGIVYGERKTPQSAVEKIVFDAVKRSKVEVGNWHTARRFIHVQDLCSGIIQCLLTESGSRLYNLSGTELLYLQDIVQITEHIIGHEVEKFDSNQKPSIRNPVPNLFVLDHNWSPKVTIYEGISRLVRLFDSMEERN